MGDQNIRFFHAKTNTLNRMNEVWGLEFGDGARCASPESIGTEAIKYFDDLFSTCNALNPVELLASLRRNNRVDLEYHVFIDFSI